MEQLRSRRVHIDTGVAVRPPPTHRFVRGPLPVAWFARAIACRGSAGTVGLVIWYCSGLERSRRVRLAPARVRELGLSPDAARRGLLALERGGLVTCERRRGKAPLVTIVSDDDSDPMLRSRLPAQPSSTRAERKGR
jgi:DNA-binding transcriptional ArsR family regulator